MQLSQRVQRIKPSATLAINAKALALKAEGQDVISLSTGEPDFDTPQHIKDAAAQAMKDGKTKYTPVDGIPSLKQAVVNKFKRDNNLHYTTDQVLVSCGGKHSIFNFLAALLDKDDEVIIPAPYWVSYPDMVLLLDGTPVIVETTIEQNFKITAEQLTKAITPKTKIVFLNSPSNPTGMAYSHKELAALADVIKQHPNIIVMSDDIYEHILWAHDKHANIVNICPELADRTVIINGVSKAYAMTGWRIGFAAGPTEIINAMKKLQSQSTSNPCSIAQAAAEAALTGDQSCLNHMLTAFKERQDYLVPALNEIDGIECRAADGAFYAFPNVQGLINLLGLKNDLEFTEYLLEKAKVAVVPGSAFGTPGCIRLSSATNLETLKEAIKRIKSAI